VQALFVKRGQAGVAGLVAVLALTVAGCSGDGGDEPDRPSTSGPATTAGPVPTGAGAFARDLDSRPTIALVTAARVYVTTAGSMRYPPQIYGLDPDSGAILSRRTSTGQPNGAALAPDGRLWIAGERHPDQPTGDGVTVFDAESLLVVERFPIPAGDALSVARVGDLMWIGSTKNVYVLDGSTGTVVATYPIAGSAYQLVPLPDGTIAAGEGEVVQVLRADGSVIATRALDGWGNARVVTDGSAVWARLPTEGGAELLRLDPASLEPLAPPVPIGSAEGGIAAGAGAVWAVDTSTHELVCADAAGSHRQAAADVTGALAVRADGALLASHTTKLTFAARAAGSGGCPSS
jgi:sugar lactone lactonase YvrE